ncbi:MAG: nucleotidyltransferase family protein [bacterium]|nr:nucleotidyltransferase family protein [bacterium]
MNDGNSTTKIAIAILAGGRSSRMGVSKAGVRLVSGKSLFDHVYDCACELNLPCIAVGHVDGVKLTRIQVCKFFLTKSLIAGRLALLGLFGSNLARHYLILACDQPLLTPELLGRLLVEVDERSTVFSDLKQTYNSPLPGRYPCELAADRREIATPTPRVVAGAANSVECANDLP